MQAKNTKTILHNNIFRIALGTIGVLLIPFVAMQFTDEVNWDETDFILIGTLLFGSGLLFELITKRLPKYKLLVGIAIVFLVVFLWIELAVGLFTNWGS